MPNIAHIVSSRHYIPSPLREYGASIIRNQRVHDLMLKIKPYRDEIFLRISVLFP